jgi:hypothetical protein
MRLRVKFCSKKQLVPFKFKYCIQYCYVYILKILEFSPETCNNFHKFSGYHKMFNTLLILFNYIKNIKYEYIYCTADCKKVINFLKLMCSDTVGCCTIGRTTSDP